MLTSIVDSTWDFTATPNTVTLHLSDDVPVTAASVSMVNSTTGLSLPASAQTLAYDSANKLLTVTLDGATNDLGVAGVVPDGDWHFTLAGITGTVDCPALSGDLNADGTVDQADLATLRSHLGDTSAAYADGDLNRDGAVDATDWLQFSPGKQLNAPDATWVSVSDLGASPQNALQLAWLPQAQTKNGLPISGYRIQQSVDGASFSNVTTAAATASAYTDASVIPGATFDYRVRAIYSDGTTTANGTWSGTVETTTPAAPVSNLLATDHGTTSFLSWTAPADAPDHYLLVASTDPSFAIGTNTTAPVTVSGTATSTTIANPAANQTTYIMLWDVDAEGDVTSTSAQTDNTPALNSGGGLGSANASTLVSVVDDKPFFDYTGTGQLIHVQFTKDVGPSLLDGTLHLENGTTNTDVPASRVQLVKFNPATNQVLDNQNVATWKVLPDGDGNLLGDGWYIGTLDNQEVYATVDGIAQPLDNSLSLNAPVWGGSFTYANSAHPNILSSVAGPFLNEYTNVVAHFGQSPASYAQGNFNYSDDVGLEDYSEVLQHFGADLYAPPTAPNQMVLNAMGSAVSPTVQIQWNPPVTPIGYTLVGYDIQHSSDGQTFTTLTADIPAGTTPMMTYPDDTLADGVREWYRARAVYSNASDQTVRSGYAPKMAITTSLLAVDNLQAAVKSATEIDLTWPAGSASAHGYKVFYKPHDVNDPTPSGADEVDLDTADLTDAAHPAYKLTNLIPGTAYDVWVQATNDRTDAAYAFESATTHAADSITASPISNLSFVEGTAFTGTVATFSDSDTTALAANFSGYIDWGDGNTSDVAASSFTQDEEGLWHISASHTYASPDTYPVDVQISSVNTGYDEATLEADVSDAALTLSSPATITAVAGVSYTGVLAHLVDADPSANTTTTSDYSANIDWGDGNTDTLDSSAFTPAIGGGFTITASHDYGISGALTPSLTVYDNGGEATQTIGLTANVSGGVSIAGNAAATAGSAYSLDLHSVGMVTPLTGWTIHFGDGTPAVNVSGTAAGVMHTFKNNAGTVQITATATNGAAFTAPPLTVVVANATIFSTPVPPTGVVASKLPDGSTHVSWVPSSAASTGFVITRYPIDGDGNVSTTSDDSESVPGDQTEIDFPADDPEGGSGGSEPADGYAYSITAENGDQVSAESTPRESFSDANIQYGWQTVDGANVSVTPDLGRDSYNDIWESGDGTVTIKIGGLPRHTYGYFGAGFMFGGFTTPTVTGTIDGVAMSYNETDESFALVTDGPIAHTGTTATIVLQVSGTDANYPQWKLMGWNTGQSTHFPSVGIVHGENPIAHEDGAQASAFMVSRNDGFEKPLDVTLDAKPLGASPAAGDDYTISGDPGVSGSAGTVHVHFAPGESDKWVYVTPTKDNDYLVDKHVEFAIQQSDEYGIPGSQLGKIDITIQHAALNLSLNPVEVAVGTTADETFTATNYLGQPVSGVPLKFSSTQPNHVAATTTTVDSGDGKVKVEGKHAGPSTDSISVAPLPGTQPTSGPTTQPAMAAAKAIKPRLTQGERQATVYTHAKDDNASVENGLVQAPLAIASKITIVAKDDQLEVRLDVVSVEAQSYKAAVNSSLARFHHPLDQLSEADYYNVLHQIPGAKTAHSVRIWSISCSAKGDIAITPKTYIPVAGPISATVNSPPPSLNGTTGTQSVTVDASATGASATISEAGEGNKPKEKTIGGVTVPLGEWSSGWTWVSS